MRKETLKAARSQRDDVEAAAQAGVCDRHRDVPALRRQLKVIASIEDPAVIGRILEHLDRKRPEAPSPFAPRAPPQGELAL